MHITILHLTLFSSSVDVSKLQPSSGDLEDRNATTLGRVAYSEEETFVCAYLYFAFILTIY